MKTVQEIVAQPEVSTLLDEYRSVAVMVENENQRLSELRSGKVECEGELAKIDNELNVLQGGSRGRPTTRKELDELSAHLDRLRSAAERESQLLKNIEWELPQCEQRLNQYGRARDAAQKKLWSAVMLNMKHDFEEVRPVIEAACAMAFLAQNGPSFDLRWVVSEAFDVQTHREELMKAAHEESRRIAAAVGVTATRDF